MNKKKLLSLGGALLLGTYFLFAQKQPVDYVNPLMGTDSKISLSNGNTSTHCINSTAVFSMKASGRRNGIARGIPFYSTTRNLTSSAL